jgi:hypothetical protein
MVSPTAAVISLGENVRPPFPTATVWTEPEDELVCVAAVVEVVVVLESELP